ncbi:hypothetical protein CRE_21475 [Caenorhabditis remanei]|uniref:Helix-turn-helix domain-containing protein n=1 Tax=Caenorhabditis remanei TaxID=31234 RepID=E3N3R0_CAERE|nr:hypothetical protein CRE_21475 [Caenorhabditis remanei]
MGSRLAPVLAVIYMDTIETPSNVYPTLLYRRYIDDIFVIAESKTTLDDVFLSLNSQADTIRLTRETPTEGWLPFLNCEIRHKNDAFSTRWYRKPSNKNILIRFDSCQPKQHKINTIRTTQRTAVANSTFDNIKYSKDLAENILRKNGYLTTVKKGVHYGKKANTRMNKQPHANVPIIPIPYVSEQITNLVRSSLKKVGLEARVIELKGISLRNTLIKNRIFDKRCVRRQCRVCPQIGEGACARRGVIYQIACSCGEIYIGESGRPLAERYNEHS